jgi:hypothetical protein
VGAQLFSDQLAPYELRTRPRAVLAYFPVVGPLATVRRNRVKRGLGEHGEPRLTLAQGRADPRRDRTSPPRRSTTTSRPNRPVASRRPHHQRLLETLRIAPGNWQSSAPDHAPTPTGSTSAPILPHSDLRLGTRAVAAWAAGSMSLRFLRPGAAIFAPHALRDWCATPESVLFERSAVDVGHHHGPGDGRVRMRESPCRRWAGRTLLNPAMVAKLRDNPARGSRSSSERNPPGTDASGWGVVYWGRQLRAPRCNRVDCALRARRSTAALR